METLNPIEALKLIRKLTTVAAGSNELSYLKTAARDVLIIIDRGPYCPTNETNSAVTKRTTPDESSELFAEGDPLFCPHP
jgi:hypothetical protein